MFISEEFRETVKKSQIGYTPEKFMRMTLLASLVVGVAMALFFFMIRTQLGFSLTYVFLGALLFFAMAFILVRLIPYFSMQNKKVFLESDLLYSARHLLLKLESGSSLINSLESVSKLDTNSSLYFKELIFDISMGTPVEEAVDKAIEYSPSKAYAKFLEEINNSLRTGADIQKTLKATLKDITRQHLIKIQEYGKKLNPMTMFYMIIGTMLPSLGTAMLVVGVSFVSGINIGLGFLLGIAAFVLIVQIFFVLGFKSLKPAVMD